MKKLLTYQFSSYTVFKIVLKTELLSNFLSHQFLIKSRVRSHFLTKYPSSFSSHLFVLPVPDNQFLTKNCVSFRSHSRSSIFVLPVLTCSFLKENYRQCFFIYFHPAISQWTVSYKSSEKRFCIYETLLSLYRIVEPFSYRQSSFFSLTR